MLRRLFPSLVSVVSILISFAVAAEKRPELFLQTGHSNRILATAYSPDGRYIATAGDDRSARLWDAVSGVELRPFFGHTQTVHCVAFSPDGKQLITGSLDKTARIWDVATGKEVRQFDCETLMVTSAVFSRDGRQVLTACYANLPHFKKGTARLWDAATGQLLQTFTGHDRHVTSVALSPDGKQVLTGSDDATARLWDAATGKELRRFIGHTDAIRSVAYSSDGKLVATGASDKTARQWDPATGKELHRFEAPGYLTRSVLVFPDARRAGTSSLDGSADLWDIATGKKLCHVERHSALISCGAFSPNGRQIVTGSLDNSARIWDVATGKELHRLESKCGEVAAAVFSTDGKRILTGSKDCVGRLWNATNGQELQQFLGHTSPITAVAMSSDGRMAVTASGGHKSTDHTARLWDTTTGKEIRYFLGHTSPINSVAISPDGKHVVTGSGGYKEESPDYTARLWDVATGKETFRFMNHKSRIVSVLFSPDGKHVLSSGWDGAWLWDRTTGKPIKHFRLWTHRTKGPNAAPNEIPAGGLIETACFDVDGKHAYFGRTDWSIWRIDLDTGKEVAHFDADYEPQNKLLGTLASTKSVAVSPDGKRLLAGFADGMVRVWDTATGMEMRNLTQHTGAVRSVTFSPDGKQMLTASDDGTTRLWDASTGRELARIIGLRKAADWVVVTPEGYFDGSLDGRHRVMWRVGGELFPLESYEKRFHRPDLVARALRGQPIVDQPSLPVDRTPPKVGLEVEETLPEAVTVKVLATPGSKAANIVGIQITADGRDLAPKRGASIVRKRTADGRVAFYATVDFPPGKQNALIAAMVTDDIGLQSDPAQLFVERPGKASPVPSKLYVLTVGVSRYKIPQYNLNFCHADAEALATMLQRQKGHAFADVRSQVLINEQATVSNVAAGLDWLQKSCSSADVAVVLFAGHGCLDSGSLYYLTHDADVDDLRHTAVRWEDIARGLKNIRARQVLFFSDCCHAGAFGQQTATQDQLAEALVKEAGVMVFASSRGNEKSAERSEWGHGAFVRALLDGLGGRADLIADGQINISELQTYVVDQVSKLTEGCQHPYLPRLERFDPGLVLAETL